VELVCCLLRAPLPPEANLAFQKPTPRNKYLIAGSNPYISGCCNNHAFTRWGPDGQYPPPPCHPLPQPQIQYRDFKSRSK